MCKLQKAGQIKSDHFGIYIVNHRNSLTPQNPLTLNQTYLKTVDFYKILFTYTKFYAYSENEFRFF